MLGGRRAYQRWLPIAGEQAARHAERAIVWQRGGLIAALAPVLVAGIVLPRPDNPDSPDPMGLPFTYMIVVLVVTGVVSFLFQLRIRNDVYSHWQVTSDEKRTLAWRHPETVERWLSVHRPGASTEGQG